MSKEQSQISAITNILMKKNDSSQNSSLKANLEVEEVKKDNKIDINVHEYNKHSLSIGSTNTAFKRKDNTLVNNNLNHSNSNSVSVNMSNSSKVNTSNSNKIKTYNKQKDSKNNKS